jgi:hypothetical protein
MSVFKQGEIWWYEFTLNGHRIRKSSKTADRDLAKLLEAEHRRSLEDGTGGISPTYQVTGDTTKNDIRPRLLPLDPVAEKAFRRALERANRLGAHRDDHFLFPLRVNRCTWDPTKPASRSWLRKQYVRLRELTGIKHLRPHA